MKLLYNNNLYSLAMQKDHMIKNTEALIDDFAEKFADYVLQCEYIKQTDGTNFWWGHRTKEIYLTSKELLNEFKQHYGK